MKKAIALLLLFVSNAVGASKDASTNTLLQKEPQPITLNSDSEYRLSLYESVYKKWSLHLSGKVSPDYDIFGNELKTNVFTTFGAVSYTHLTLPTILRV